MVNLNDKIQVNIIDINHQGQGVAKVDDLVIFVDGLITADKAIVEIIDIKKSFAIAKVIEILEYSPKRVQPPCKYYDKCGGCQLLDLSYAEQLIYKRQRVENELKKAGVDLNGITINETIGCENTLGYRNKTAFPVGFSNNTTIIGPYEKSSHRIVDINKCLLHNDICNDILNKLRELFNKYKIQPYNQKTKRGIIRHIVLRSNKLGEVMVILVTGSDKLPCSDKIVSELTAEFKQIKTIVQNINSKFSKEILGTKNRALYGDGVISDTIEDLSFTLSPHTFFQVNPEQTVKLYNKALEYAQLTKDDVCFDLYCGIGTISLMAARKAKAIYGVEVVEQSIIDARKNAKVNNIDNAEFYTGAVEDVLPKLYKKGIKSDVIIVDPPRKGCEKEVIQTILDMKPKRAVYVSCNPATLARDLKLMQEGGYKIEEVTPVDMFANSHHVETVVLMSKNK